MKNKIIKIKPRHSWVLVKPVKVQTETDSGLVIPDSVEKEQKAQGEILDLGPDVKGLKKGDMVLYGKYAGEEIQLANKSSERYQVDYVLLLDDDILAVIE